MEIRSPEDTIEIIVDTAKEILDLQIQKKVIDTDIKSVKQSAKEKGIAVGIVMKVLTEIKAAAKKSEADKLEAEILTEKLEANTDIQTRIARLNSED